MGDIRCAHTTGVSSSGLASRSSHTCTGLSRSVVLFHIHHLRTRGSSGTFDVSKLRQRHDARTEGIFVLGSTATSYNARQVAAAISRGNVETVVHDNALSVPGRAHVPRSACRPAQRVSLRKAVHGRIEVIAHATQASSHGVLFWIRYPREDRYRAEARRWDLIVWVQGGWRVPMVNVVVRAFRNRCPHRMHKLHKRTCIEQHM